MQQTDKCFYPSIYVNSKEELCIFQYIWFVIFNIMHRSHSFVKNNDYLSDIFLKDLESMCQLSSYTAI